LTTLGSLAKQTSDSPIHWPAIAVEGPYGRERGIRRNPSTARLDVAVRVARARLLPGEVSSHNLRDGLRSAKKAAA